MTCVCCDKPMNNGYGRDGELCTACYWLGVQDRSELYLER